MKNTKQQNQTGEFAERLSPLAQSAEFCQEVADRVRALKAELLENFRRDFALTSNGHLIRRALDEAEALAWLTPFPQLFLPELAEEKVQELRLWWDRQQQVWLRQSRLSREFARAA